MSLDPIQRFEIKVTQAVVDANRHVNNVAYVQWMQDAAVRHAEAAGCTRLTVAANASWVARHHHIEYLTPAVVGDTVAVLTWVANMRPVRSLRKYMFLRAGEETLLARGETDWVFVDARTGKPKAIPKEIQDCFLVLLPEQEPRAGSNHLRT
jgi:acyl-CoA thioester hydrolase